MVNNYPDALVYLVDDEYAVRDSLTLLIQSTGQLARSFESAQDFLDNYNPAQPGCLILDVRMPTMDGLQLQQELKKRDIYIPIIFISGNAEIPDSAKAFRAGAVDFLEKPFDNNLLLKRIKEAIGKDIDMREKLAERRNLQQLIDCLTPREKEVLSLIINSHSSKESAKMLDISPRTIEVHRSRIMKKMQVDSVTELVAMLRDS